MRLETLHIDNYAYLDVPRIKATFEDKDKNSIQLQLDPAIAIQIVQMCSAEITQACSDSLAAFAKDLEGNMLIEHDNGEEVPEQEPFLSTEEEPANEEEPEEGLFVPEFGEPEREAGVDIGAEPSLDVTAPIEGEEEGT